MMNGGGKGWYAGADGQVTMPDTWKELLTWLLQGPERSPRTQREWAAQNGIHEDSVRRIKRDPRFLKEWDQKAAELNINPERVQSVVDALWQRASSGDVKAASLYLQYIDKFTPTRKITTDERDVSSLSDAELAAEMEAEVRHLRAVGDNE